MRNNGNVLKGGLVIVGVLVVLALIVGGAILSGYNRVVGMDENVKQEWAQVENQLQRRYDLIPNLVETVKGVAGQEQEVFLGIAKSREAYFQAQRQGTVDEQVQAAGHVESALARLLVLQEQYPQLRSSEAFNKLQDQLEGTENRLTVARQNYNESVEQLNAYRRKFPGSIYASFAGVEAASYFEIPEVAKETPKVDFSELREKEKDAKQEEK